ncbi:MAG: hypothetical protein ACU4F9_11885 [Arcticibacter sp.]
MAEKTASEQSNQSPVGRLKPNRKAVVFVICLIISATAWFATTLTGTYTTTYTLPLAYHNTPYNARLVGELPNEAVFHYQGSGWDLLYLAFRRMPDSLVIDLGKSDSSSIGKISIRSLSLISQLPDDPMPYKVEPEWIAPGIISETSKKIPVLAKLDIQFRNRFDSTSIATLTPDSIQISGPPAQLKLINSVETVKLRRQDVFQSLSVDLEIKKSLPKGVLQSHTKVQVNIPVGEFTEGSFMVPVQLKNTGSKKIKLLPSKVRVVFQAELSAIAEIKSEDFVLIADAEQAIANGKPLELVVAQKPSNAKRIRLEPERIEFLIEP